MNRLQGVDRVLGRLIMRSTAIVAFLAAMATAVFGAIVLFNGHFMGVVILALGALFFWFGRLAWRDRAGLGEILERDFTPARKDKDG